MREAGEEEKGAVGTGAAMGVVEKGAAVMGEGQEAVLMVGVARAGAAMALGGKEKGVGEG